MEKKILEHSQMQTIRGGIVYSTPRLEEAGANNCTNGTRNVGGDCDNGRRNRPSAVELPSEL